MATLKKKKKKFVEKKKKAVSAVAGTAGVLVLVQRGAAPARKWSTSLRSNLLFLGEIYCFEHLV